MGGVSAQYVLVRVREPSSPSRPGQLGFLHEYTVPTMAYRPFIQHPDEPRQKVLSDAHTDDGVHTLRTKDTGISSTGIVGATNKEGDSTLMIWAKATSWSSIQHTGPNTAEQSKSVKEQASQRARTQSSNSSKQSHMTTCSDQPWLCCKATIGRTLKVFLSG